jgi:signal transduction histidine kinase
MTGASMTPPSRSWPASLRTRVAAGPAATVQAVACLGLAASGAALLLALASPLLLLGLGLGLGLVPDPLGWGYAGSHPGMHLRPLPLAGVVFSLLLLPSVLLAIRRLAALTRRLAGQWWGMPIADPYPSPRTSGLQTGYLDRYRWLASPSTGRDLLWLLVNACLGWALLAISPALVLAGTINLVSMPGPPQGHVVPAWVKLTGLFNLNGNSIPGPDGLVNSPGGLLVLGVAFIAVGLAVAPALLRGYGLLACSLLGPTRQAELALRASNLARTRSEAIDAGAAEMRRIERDLHDGAQARLVAMGMTLDAASHMLTDNPAAARALVLEARDSSARALAELRDLVRGIHPPVLADRGLADAVRALALDAPLAATVACELSGRLAAPVESAAYFAVSELLTNVSKHAEAGRAWIDIRHAGGMLRIGVTDDGRGGADPAGGTGLRGIERRLAAFDGVLAVSSPRGGPTAVTMEIPCSRRPAQAPSC